jgi:hypothetical protein
MELRPVLVVSPLSVVAFLTRTAPPGNGMNPVLRSGTTLGPITIDRVGRFVNRRASEDSVRREKCRLSLRESTHFRGAKGDYIEVHATPDYRVL